MAYSVGTPKNIKNIYQVKYLFKDGDGYQDTKVELVEAKNSKDAWREIKEDDKLLINIEKIDNGRKQSIGQS